MFKIYEPLFCIDGSYSPKYSKHRLPSTVSHLALNLTINLKIELIFKNYHKNLHHSLQLIFFLLSIPNQNFALKSFHVELYLKFVSMVIRNCFFIRTATTATHDFFRRPCDYYSKVKRIVLKTNAIENGR